jgi:mono/diheme cytochrome c family protein
VIFPLFSPAAPPHEARTMNTFSKWFGVASSVALLAVACHTGTALPPQSLDSPGGRLFNGYTKPDVKCFSCHNGDAKGANGPNLGERVPKLSDDAILKAIDDGPGYMPSFKDKLTAAEKQEIIAWLRERFKSG